MKTPLTVFCALVFFVLEMPVVFAWPDMPKTTHILVNNEVIPLEDSLNFSRKDLSNTRIHLFYEGLSNINFERSLLSNADVRETGFVDCSFKNADLTNINAYDASFTGCDFTDAVITGCKSLGISKEQLISTRNYKVKGHWSAPLHVGFSICDFSGVDFSNCNLSGSNFFGVNVTGCNFENAIIFRTNFGKTFVKDQLMQTSDFKSKKMTGIVFWGGMDLSNTDLSGFNLTDCYFGSSHPASNFTNVNFTDAVISGCNFDNLADMDGLPRSSQAAIGLTLSQIKSTWNYKTGNMAGIKLPKELQEKLDAERKGKEAEP